MTSTYKSQRYFNPGSWFHTFVPNRTLPASIRIVLSDNIPGWPGLFAVAVVIAAIVITVVVSIRPAFFTSRNSLPADTLRKDSISVLTVFALVCLVYVCSTSLTGWFPNIITAAWYRTETRPLTMIPLAVIPLIAFAVSSTTARAYNTRLAVRSSTAHPDNNGIEDAQVFNNPGKMTTVRIFARRWSATMVVLILAIASLASNSERSQLRQALIENTSLNDNFPDEQLTLTKYHILQQVTDITGTQALIVSDPLNGSMYGSTLFGANMLYPIYNPLAEGNGAVFGQVQRAFDSGNRTELLNTVCAVQKGQPAYFLAMGPQAPSLQIFTFKDQFNPFHRQELIDKYVQDGGLSAVKDFSNMKPYTQGWMLYRFTCSD